MKKKLILLLIIPIFLFTLTFKNNAYGFIFGYDINNMNGVVTLNYVSNSEIYYSLTANNIDEVQKDIYHKLYWMGASSTERYYFIKYLWDIRDAYNLKTIDIPLEKEKREGDIHYGYSYQVLSYNRFAFANSIYNLPNEITNLKLVFINNGTEYSTDGGLTNDWFIVYPLNSVGEIIDISFWPKDLTTNTYTLNRNTYDFNFLRVTSYNNQETFNIGYNKGFGDGYNSGKTSGDLGGYTRGYNEARGVYGKYYQNTWKTAEEWGIHERQEGYNEGIGEDLQAVYDRGYGDGSTQSFLANIDKWIVPAIIIVLVGGGFISYMNIKKRED